jgi:hypothetical protein
MKRWDEILFDILSWIGGAVLFIGNKIACLCGKHTYYPIYYEGKKKCFWCHRFKKEEE